MEEKLSAAKYTSGFKTKKKDLAPEKPDYSPLHNIYAVARSNKVFRLKMFFLICSFQEPLPHVVFYVNKKLLFGALEGLCSVTEAFRLLRHIYYF